MTTDRSVTTESKRLARLKAVWQSDKPDPSELLRARTRWVVLEARRRRPPTRPRALVVLAVLFGGAGALAATGKLAWTTTSVESPTTPAVSAHALERAPAPRRRGTAPAPAAVPAPLSVPVPALATSPVPAPAMTPEAPAHAITHTPRPVHVSPTVSPPRVAPAPTASPPRAASAPAEPQAEGQGAWQRAAEALRRGDDHQATLALQELAASSDQYTRDTAALAKAQLDVAAGHWDRARPVLEQIAARGATPLLRRRAHEVLAQQP